MFVAVRVVLTDGRVVEITHEVEDDERLSPAQVLERAVHDGELPLSDSERIPVASVASVEFAHTDAPTGPGWGPGLQDEDAASAASSDYFPPSE